MSIHTAEGTFDKIMGLFAAIAGGLILFAMVLVCTDIAWNLLTGRTLSWVAEIVEYTLLWMTFLGSAWVLKIDRHIKMEIVIDRLGVKAKAYVYFLTSCLGVVLCVCLAFFSGRVTWHHIQTDFRLMTYMEVPSAWIDVIIPIGFILLCLEFGRRSISALKHLKQ